MGALHAVSHPVIDHKLSLMRDENTSSADFRHLLREITLLLGYEATRDLPATETLINTPLERASFPTIDEQSIAVVPVLRAGLGMTEGLLELLPNAHVGFIGLERNEATHLPREYYTKLPDNIGDSLVFLVDPMLATGGSAIDAAHILKRCGCKRIRMVNLVAAPQGIQAFQSAHPDIDLYVGAVDRDLNENAYIVPGLGDAGDRIFGTDGK